MVIKGWVVHEAQSSRFRAHHWFHPHLLAGCQGLLLLITTLIHVFFFYFPFTTQPRILTRNTCNIKHKQINYFFPRLLSNLNKNKPNLKNSSTKTHKETPFFKIFFLFSPKLQEHNKIVEFETNNKILKTLLLKVFKFKTLKQKKYSQQP